MRQQNNLLTSTSSWKYLSSSVSYADNILQESFDRRDMFVKEDSEGPLNPCKCEGIFQQSKCNKCEKKKMIVKTIEIDNKIYRFEYSIMENKFHICMRETVLLI